MTSIVNDAAAIGKLYRQLGNPWIPEKPDKQPKHKLLIAESVAENVHAYKCVHNYSGRSCPAICMQKQNSGQPVPCGNFGGIVIV